MLSELDKIEISESPLEAKELAKHYNVSVRTIFRVIEAYRLPVERFLPIPGCPDYVVGTEGTIKHCPPIDWSKSLESQVKRRVLKKYKSKESGEIVVKINGKEYGVKEINKKVFNVYTL